MKLQQKMSASQVGGNAHQAGVKFGVDLNRDPVFLESEVKCSLQFAKAMLALGAVVRFTSEFAQKDHSQYQAWVQQQYLREMDSVLQRTMADGKVLQDEINALHEKNNLLKSKIQPLQKLSLKFADARRKYWNWLYDNDRDLWIVLDPIVSVQKDATYFEAFSQDESTYVKVDLPHSELLDSNNLGLGTTNIDFGLMLEREFTRVRSYRPLRLSIGADQVAIATEASKATEKKIDLPETWIQGLVQVSAAQTLASTVINLSPQFLGQLISKLESKKEKTGPRDLRFNLIPGKPIEIEIQPWGTKLIDYGSIFEGAEEQQIRLWGRRRLSLLKSLLPYAQSVQVKLLGDGMPSFWTVGIGSIQITYGFSGWNALDWAKKMKFSALLPNVKPSEEHLQAALDFLKSKHVIEASDLARVLNLKPSESAALLQTLAFHGKSMYLPADNTYVYRELVPGWQPDETKGLEERKGIELASGQDAFLVIDRSLKEENVILKARTKDQFEVVIERDNDNRIIYAQCKCHFFEYNKMRLGPCRHIVALSLM